MAKRLFQIAKELGVESKAIIDKCVAEGVPPDTVKNHMASIAVGLEASIREWFSTPSEASSTSTAVETTAHVDIDKVRTRTARATAKARSKTAAARAGADTTEPPDDSSTSVAVATPEPPAQTNGGMTHASPAAAAPAVAEPPPAISVPAPEARPTSAPAPTHAASPAPAAEPPAKHTAAAKATVTAKPAHPAEAPPETRSEPASTVKSAPINVPRRPQVVAPIGKKLEMKSPVKLSGPKIVRIEAPEAVDRRPARRAAPGIGSPGAGEMVGAEGGDRARSPRRNTSGKKREDAAPAGRAPGGPGRTGVPARRRAATDDSLSSGKFREQDLLEREARLQHAGGFLKKRRHELKLKGGQAGERAISAAQTGGAVVIQAPFTIKDLSAATGVKAADIVKKLFLQGIMASINSGIDPERAQEIMIDYNIELQVNAAKTAEQAVTEQFTQREAVDVVSRGPIVTILGHVDHGKTSLLDRIRNANVAAGEAGGITQATSAFRVPLTIGGHEKHIVFLDTPGHEAFTEMRARGASMTDVVVLVVSAPEGVMPQTIESINHAKAAKVPIVVALNKIDRPDATDGMIQKTLGQLAEQGLNPIEWGGDTEVVRTSAVTGQGIEELLEILDLQGQILELKADAKGPARGTVVEARMQEGRGATANVIVQDGELNVGDFIVVGRGFGRVRDITDDRGRKLKSVGPAMPVQISGFDELPDAGDKFYIVDSLRQAQEAAEQRRHRDRETQLAQPKVTLDSLFSQMAESTLKEVLIVLKADVQGSVDVLKREIEKVSTNEVKVRVLHAAVGGITESDVLLAEASRAVVIGFNVIPSGKARHLAEARNVEIRSYQVIYNITDDIRKAAEGMLEPELRQDILGHAEVRQVFKITRVGSIAGCYVTDGTVQRDALIRVTRNGVVIENDRVLEQLKRFKDDAKDVRAGMECGMKILGYDDIKEGDVLECYKNVQVKRSL